MSGFLTLYLPCICFTTSSESPTQFEFVGAQLPRPLDSADQRLVLGDVVGRVADRLAVVLEHVALAVANDHAYRGRPGVAPGSAIHVHGQLHRLESTAQARG